MLIDAISFEESAATLILTWSKNTRKVQVQGNLTMLDRAKEQLINSSKLIVNTVSRGRFLLHQKVVSVRLQCCDVLRIVIIWSLSLENGSESNRRRATFVPQDPAFGAIVEQITTGGTCLFDRWPEW